MFYIRYSVGSTYCFVILLRMLLAIVVFQVLMIGVFGLKKNPTVAALSVPPLVFTVIFKVFIGLYFQPVSAVMELDNLIDEGEENKPDEDFLKVRKLTRSLFLNCPNGEVVKWT